MGGTPVQLWSGPAALKQCGNTTAPGFWRPYSWLFWNMVMPLRGLQLKAVVWYQGEANVGPDRNEPLNWGTGPTGPVI